ncbi:hypothetical protein [Dankookia sp. P2]|uniref:hypothetical protein n=1 Tax=Dankookia sp. P2 TaxID=3423955 RepID=UPI003D67E975
MNAAAPLQADRREIDRFVAALFHYADDGTFVSLHSFHDGGQKVFAIEAHVVTGRLDALTDAALDQAGRAARAGVPVVFAPPIATFRNPPSATEADLCNGLALSVECNRAPTAARTKLESLLGPATVLVASGGEWLNPDTGEYEPKLHLHWRPSEPTRHQAEHAAPQDRAQPGDGDRRGGPDEQANRAPVALAGLVAPEGAAPACPDRGGGRCRA